MEEFTKNPSPLINTIATLFDKDRDRAILELLASATYQIQQTGYDNWDGGLDLYTLYIFVPPSLYAEVSSSVEDIQEAILENAHAALISYQGSHLSHVIISPQIIEDDSWRNLARASVTAELVELVEAQRNMMLSVATGGPMIKDVNPTYLSRRTKINLLLKERGLQNPNPFNDLWEWYGKWSTDLPKYNDRRVFISRLFAPLLDRLRLPEIQALTTRPVEPTGWDKLDVSISEIRKMLFTSTLEEGFQSVGLMCRELIISLAQEVYDPELHISQDGTTPSKTDAKRMLTVYLRTEYSGSSFEELRRCVRAIVDLANSLQHDRSANIKDATLCYEASMSLVNIFGILSGRKSFVAEE